LKPLCLTDWVAWRQNQIADDQGDPDAIALGDKYVSLFVTHEFQTRANSAPMLGMVEFVTALYHAFGTDGVTGTLNVGNPFMSSGEAQLDSPDNFLFLKARRRRFTTSLACECFVLLTS
jgi:hypothetical protein